jgi:Flp pilus assembly protein TadG
MELMKNPMARNRVRGEKGVSMVEFALIFPVFMLMIFALIDFGVYFYYESTLTHITRVTMRSAVTGNKVLDPAQTNGSYLTRKQAVLKAAKEACALPLIKFRSDGLTNGVYYSDLITFYNTTNNGVTWQVAGDDLGGSGARVKMTMTQRADFLTPFVKMLNPNNVFSNKISISTTYKSEDFDIN